MHARVKSAAAFRLGGAVLRMLGPAGHQAASSGGAGEDDGAVDTPLCAPDWEGRQRLNGYDRIVPASPMLGTSLAAQNAFGRLMFEEGGMGCPRPLPAHVELHRVLDAGPRSGVSDLTIAGSAAHDFAQSMRYAHIPGANRVLLVYDDTPDRKPLLARVFKRVRLAFLLPLLRHCGSILSFQRLPLMLWPDRYRPESLRQNV